MQPAGLWKLGIVCANARLETGGERRLERADVDAVRLERHGEQLGAARLEREQRAVVGGRLDDHRVAGLDQVVEQHQPGLERSVEQDDALGSTPWRSAIHSRSGAYPYPGP